MRHIIQQQQLCGASRVTTSAGRHAGLAYCRVPAHTQQARRWRKKKLGDVIGFGTQLEARPPVLGGGSPPGVRLIGTPLPCLASGRRGRPETSGVGVLRAFA